MKTCNDNVRTGEHPSYKLKWSGTYTFHSASVSDDKGNSTAYLPDGTVLHNDGTLSSHGFSFPSVNVAIP